MNKSFFGESYNESWRPEREHLAEIEGQVKIGPVPITAGEEITVCYNGLLARSGADQVFLRTGYGLPNDWHRVHDYKMERTSEGWQVNFPVDSASRLNFCFKDSANNWDNNDGRNWSYEIHNGNW